MKKPATTPRNAPARREASSAIAADAPNSTMLASENGPMRLPSTLTFVEPEQNTAPASRCSP